MNPNSKNVIQINKNVSLNPKIIQPNKNNILTNINAFRLPIASPKAPPSSEPIGLDISAMVAIKYQMFEMLINWLNCVDLRNHEA